jgi:hypothetical protein
MIVTRMMFGPEAHPKVVFQPVRALTNPEGVIVKAHQQNPRTSEMLNDKAVAAFMDPDAMEDEGGVVGTLPPANDAGTPPGTGWTKPEAKPEPKAEAKPTLTPAEQKIADLEAQLAAAKAPKVEPKPEPVLTPEQIKIRDLEAQLAQAQARERRPRSRRPRSKPVAPLPGRLPLRVTERPRTA